MSKRLTRGDAEKLILRFCCSDYNAATRWKLSEHDNDFKLMIAKTWLIKVRWHSAVCRRRVAKVNKCLLGWESEQLYQSVAHCPFHNQCRNPPFPSQFSLYCSSTHGELTKNQTWIFFPLCLLFFSCLSFTGWGLFWTKETWAYSGRNVININKHEAI